MWAALSKRIHVGMFSMRLQNIAALAANMLALAARPQKRTCRMDK